MSSSTKTKKRTFPKDKHSAKTGTTKSFDAKQDAKERKVFVVAGLVAVAVLLLLYLLFRNS
jgi:predicted RND superfamily exporter protein